MIYALFMPYYYVLDHIKNEIVQGRVPVFFNNVMSLLKHGNKNLSVSVPLCGPRKYKLCACDACCSYSSRTVSKRYIYRFRLENPFFPSLRLEDPNYFESKINEEIGLSFEQLNNAKEMVFIDLEHHFSTERRLVNLQSIIHKPNLKTFGVEIQLNIQRLQIWRFLDALKQALGSPLNFRLYFKEDGECCNNRFSEFPKEFWPRLWL